MVQLSDARAATTSPASPISGIVTLHSYILSGHLTFHPVVYAETCVAAVPARRPDDAGRFISDALPPS